MSNHVIYTRLSPDEVGGVLALIPQMIAGEVADPLGIGYGIRLRVGVKLLSLIKQAFIEKSRGGRGSDGITWPPLTRAYLAYGKRFQKDGGAENRALKKAAGLGRANNRRGLLTAAQDKRWKQYFGQAFKHLAATVSIGEARARAAAIAWAKLKSEGAKTKLDVFGGRQAEILRDTDNLYNSLSPGTVTEAGPTANYSAAPDQIFTVGPSNVIVGTNVPYAGAHHAAKNPRKRRPLWPEPEQWPQTWIDQLEATAEAGVVAAVIFLLSR